MMRWDGFAEVAGGHLAEVFRGVVGHLADVGRGFLWR